MVWFYRGFDKDEEDDTYIDQSQILVDSNVETLEERFWKIHDHIKKKSNKTDDDKHFSTFIKILKNPESFKALRRIVSRACLTLIDEKEELVMKSMLDKLSISNFPIHVVLEEITARFPGDTNELATKFLLHCVIEISKFKEFSHFGIDANQNEPLPDDQTELVGSGSLRRQPKE
ncbi:uncharacterized protein [Clytia hemisphaerica]|uniref:uncharacterized protein n=1 Tax=Clytia hemisphaerica TaxID=252671 RepID=UPI0034D6896D